MANTEINVEEIMQQIRREIKEKGLVDDAPKFAEVLLTEDMEFDYEELLYWTDGAVSRKEIPWYRPIVGNKLKVFIQKIIRRAIIFMIKPIVEGQNEYNQMVSNVLLQNVCYIKQCEKRISELEELLKNKEN